MDIDDTGRYSSGLVSVSKPLQIVPERHMPRRDDELAAWLKAKRDEHPAGIRDEAWHALDDVLEEYRQRADYGLTMTEVLDGTQ